MLDIPPGGPTHRGRPRFLAALSVDPEDHHLHVSLGCAIENLSHAALALGQHAEALFDPSGQGSIVVDLHATRATVTPLFQAISERQCTRGDYDGKPNSNTELLMLEQAGAGNGVKVMLLTERAAKETVLEYVAAANTAQMRDPAFVAELTTWRRFGAAEAQRMGDGLFSGTSGSPVVPRWVGKPLMGLFFTPKSENERYASQIRNSSGIAVFVSERSDKAHWIEAGRSYERFALQTTALGLRNAFLNQPVVSGRDFSVHGRRREAADAGEGQDTRSRCNFVKAPVARQRCRPARIRKQFQDRDRRQRGACHSRIELPRTPCRASLD